MTPHRRSPGWGDTFKSGLTRSISFVVGWFLLTEGAMQDAWLGLTIALLATASSFLVLPPGAVASLRLIGVLRYLGYFAIQSIRGGVDVSLRALRPSMPLNPGFLSLDIDIEPEGLRILFAWTVSLLPGTASVNLDGHHLDVHVLFKDESAELELERLETVVRGLVQPS